MSLTGTAASNGLTTITECLCPGYNVIYQCTVTGGAFTVWGGTAFQCAGDAITLRNSDFGSLSSPAVGVCNNGQIIGRGILQENNCYTSQLNVTFNEDLVGRTVTCGVDDGSLTTVDSMILATSTSKYISNSRSVVKLTSLGLLSFHVDLDTPADTLVVKPHPTHSTCILSVYDLVVV